VETLEQIKARIEASLPGARLQIIPNESPSGQRSLQVDAARADAVARFLRDDPQLGLDYASNVTGVDWPDTVVKEKVKVKKVVDGVEKEVEENRREEAAGLSRSRLSPVFHELETWAAHYPTAHR